MPRHVTHAQTGAPILHCQTIGTPMIGCPGMLRTDRSTYLTLSNNRHTCDKTPGHVMHTQTGAPTLHCQTIGTPMIGCPGTPRTASLALHRQPVVGPVMRGKWSSPALSKQTSMVDWLSMNDCIIPQYKCAVFFDGQWICKKKLTFIKILYNATL